MAISEVKIRAQVSVGSLLVETPYVLSFSVTRNRNNPGTMSASLKVPLSFSGASTDSDVYVNAGEKDNLIRIFTGDLRKMTISPCWDDPTYIVLNIEAIDFLARLQDTKFTRRQVSHEHMFALITGFVRRPHTGRLETLNEPTKMFALPSETSPTGVRAYGGSPTAVAPKSHDNRRDGFYSAIGTTLSYSTSGG